MELTSDKRSKRAFLLVNILAVVFFTVFRCSSPPERDTYFVKYLGYGVSITAYLLIFYLNFFLLIQKFMVRKNGQPFVNKLLVIGSKHLFVSVARLLFHAPGRYPSEHMPPPRSTFMSLQDISL